MPRKKKKKSVSINPVVGLVIVLLVGLVGISLIKNTNFSKNDSKEKDPEVLLFRGIRNPPRDDRHTGEKGKKKLPNLGVSILIKDAVTGQVVSGNSVEESKSYIVGLASFRNPNKFLPKTKFVGKKYTIKFLPPVELRNFKYARYGSHRNVACRAVSSGPCELTCTSSTGCIVGAIDPKTNNYAHEDKDYLTWDGNNYGIIISYRMRGGTSKTVKRNLSITPSSIGNATIALSKTWSGNVNATLTSHGKLSMSGTNVKACDVYLFENGKQFPLGWKQKEIIPDTNNTCSVSFRKRNFVKGKTYYVVGGMVNGLIQNVAGAYIDFAYRKLVY